MKKSSQPLVVRYIATVLGDASENLLRLGEADSQFWEIRGSESQKLWDQIASLVVKVSLAFK